jgi:hypothetical protein
MVIDEAMEAGLAADHPVTVAAKHVRLELLKVKADLKRELSESSWTNHVRHGAPLGSGHQHVRHWALGHRFPAPHGEPAV